MSFTWDRAAYLSLYLKTKTEFLASHPGCTAPAYGGMIRRIGWTVAVHDAAVKAAAERGEPMPTMPVTLKDRLVGKRIPQAAVAMTTQEQVMPADIAAGDNTGPDPAPIVQKTGDCSHTETAVLQISDPHFGAETETFNLEVFQARMNSLGNRLEDIHRRVTSGTPIDGLRVFLLGDVLDGEGIFASQPAEQWETSGRLQATGFADYMVPWLLRQKAIWGNLEIDCVAGNHGRTGKDRHKMSNFDLVAYQYLKYQLEPHGVRVTMPEQGSPFSMITHVRGHKWLLFHGNQIKSGGVTPQGSVVNRIIRWFSMRKFRNIVAASHGHFHTFCTTLVNGIWIFSLGTMKSDDDHAAEGMGWDSGLIWTVSGVSDSRVLTWSYNLNLEQVD